MYQPFKCIYVTKTHILLEKKKENFAHAFANVLQMSIYVNSNTKKRKKKSHTKRTTFQLIRTVI